ncbi:D-aminoacyl-tRNA deacylase [Thiocystis violacea]|uniref:D-aminoacyl-tRNA deacylase n=1 Tax=Thiocystis violacea TaxID=13725 RepID=UPI001906A34F|nr:D-aminoacyl-tRNA deacylase [Thiocystis violacea]MBK1719060.1 D-tyrosyl-tRNA(Tyr) deacylase [Thiocystis violacea]
MIGLLQRVSQARVEVGAETVGAIGRGLLVLIGVQKGDTEALAERLLERLLGYRVFPDAEDRMNLSLCDIGGGLLLVPQFTLAADTRKGTRASFTSAAPPDEGRRLFAHLVERARLAHPIVATGRFGADMRVSLINEGPVTFWLET